MEEFDFDIRIPLPSVNFNPDDGLFLGAGMMWRKDGFRKDPFATSQSVSANFALATSSYNLAYSGTFTDALGKADFKLDLDVKAPNFVNNFFGLGNESVYNDDLDLTFYRTRFEEYSIKPSVLFNLGSNAHINLGASYRFIEIQNSSNRFISDFPGNGLDPNRVFEEKNYLGWNIGIHLDNRNSAIVATRGITFNTEAELCRRGQRQLR